MARIFSILMAALPALAQEKPVALLSGMGVEHRSNVTRNPDAQKYFDQGIALLYGFNRPEAVRSFRKVVELDRNAAMGYWGISRAFGPYINMNGDPSYDPKESCAAVEEGLALPGIGPADRAWLEAARTSCPDFADTKVYI